MEQSHPPLYAILGVTGGIGSKLCQQLYAQGARLVANTRRKAPPGQIESELGATAIPIDVRNFDKVEAADGEFSVRRKSRRSGVSHRDNFAAQR